MKKIDVGQTLGILANIGVIAGILFLAFEIQQSNRIAIASSEIGIRNSFLSMNESIYTNTDVAELLAKATDSNVEFSTVEEIKIYSFVLGLMNTWLSVEIAYANGLVPPETYGVIEDDARSFLAEYPATLPVWHQAIDDFPALAPTEVFKTLNRVLNEYGP